MEMCNTTNVEGAYIRGDSSTPIDGGKGIAVLRVTKRGRGGLSTPGPNDESAPNAYVGAGVRHSLHHLPTRVYLWYSTCTNIYTSKYESRWQKSREVLSLSRIVRVRRGGLGLEPH